MLLLPRMSRQRRPRWWPARVRRGAAGRGRRSGRALCGRRPGRAGRGDRAAPGCFAAPARPRNEVSAADDARTTLTPPGQWLSMARSAVMILRDPRAGSTVVTDTSCASGDRPAEHALDLDVAGRLSQQCLCWWSDEPRARSRRRGILHQWGSPASWRVRQRLSIGEDRSSLIPGSLTEACRK